MTGIIRSAYSKDIDYLEKVLNIIDKYNLEEYDSNEVIKNTATNTNKSNKTT